MRSLFIYLFVIMAVFSCNEEKPEENAIARVNDKYLHPEDMNFSFPEDLSPQVQPLAL